MSGAGLISAQPGRTAMRLIRMRGVKAVAAAVVLCVVALSACTSGQSSSVSVSASTSLARSDGMPRFYLVMTGLEAVVRATADGHVTGSIAIPGPPTTMFVAVRAQPFGSADDRQFVIVVSQVTSLPGVAAVTLFQLTVSPAGRPGGLRQISFDNRNMPVTGAALSPNGTMLALSLEHEYPAQALYGSVEIINLASGAARTWTGQSTLGYWPGVPAWDGDGTVVVPWWHTSSPGAIPPLVTGIRRLDAAAPGGSLAAGRLVAFPAAVPGLQTAVIAPRSGEIIASSCRPANHTATARVLELSAANGRLVRVLRTQALWYANTAVTQIVALSMCQVLAVAGDGDQVLIQAFAFGGIDNGAFTPLPGTTPEAMPVSAAW
jgi:hypothetical protein